MLRPLLALAVLAAPALADDNDLILSRLTNQIEDAGGNPLFIPQNAELRTLASELGVVLAPHMLTPADTVGFGGFQFTADYTTTTINADGVDCARQERQHAELVTTSPVRAEGPVFRVPSFRTARTSTSWSNIWPVGLRRSLSSRASTISRSRARRRARSPDD